MDVHHNSRNDSLHSLFHRFCSQIFQILVRNSLPVVFQALLGNIIHSEPKVFQALWTHEPWLPIQRLSGYVVCWSIYGRTNFTFDILTLLPPANILSTNHLTEHIFFINLFRPPRYRWPKEMHIRGLPEQSPE